MDELEDYRRLRPETIELQDEARDRVRARIIDLAKPAKPTRSRRRVAAVSLLAAAAAFVAGFVVLNNLDSVEEFTPPVAGSTPLQSTTSSINRDPEPLLVGYEFVSLPNGVIAAPAREEVVRLGDDIESSASVQRLMNQEGTFAVLTVVPEFGGEPPPFADAAARTQTIPVSTPIGDGLLVPATEPGGVPALYIVTTSGDLIVLSSAQLNAAELEALAQRLVHR